MSDAEATGVTLRALHELGVRVALDDFGTGYSSLAYLSQLPLDVIKIDRSFVAGLQESPANLAIVRAVVGLAQGLGMAVTAEGIEREDQLAALREAGLRPRARGSSSPVRVRRTRPAARSWGAEAAA